MHLSIQGIEIVHRFTVLAFFLPDHALDALNFHRKLRQLKVLIQFFESHSFNPKNGLNAVRKPQAFLVEGYPNSKRGRLYR